MSGFVDRIADALAAYVRAGGDLYHWFSRRVIAHWLAFPRREPKKSVGDRLVGIQAINIIAGDSWVGKSTNVIPAVHSNKRFIEEIWL